MSRRAELVVLVEDRLSEVFLRRTLNQLGYRHVRVRTDYPLDGRGCGEQFVRENYAAEVDAHRRFRTARAQTPHALVVHIDADKHTVAERRRELADSLAARSATLREGGDKTAARFRPVTTDDTVVHAIPKHCTEAWVFYLLGEPADESREKRAWPKVDLGSDCRSAASRLAELVRERTAWPVNAPDSLEQARSEFAKLP